MRKIMILLFLPLILVLALLLGTGAALQQQSTFVDCGIPMGTLPNKVPKPLNGIFTEAANYSKVDPMAVTLVYYTENYQGEGVFREPAPPYGNGLPWPTSSATAAGPFQFILSTWMHYRFSNPEHQPGDVQDMKDGAYASAHYLKDLGGQPHMTFGDPANPFVRGTIANVMAQYNGSSPGHYYAETQDYVAKAFREYQRLQGSPKAPQKVQAGDNQAQVCVSPTGSGQAKVALAAVKSQLGKPYVFGAEGPNAYDCSGLMVWSLKHTGITLPRTAAAQWAATKKWQVPIAKAQPGDLVFFKSVGTNDAPGHVGMVTDPQKGLMINALKPGTSVKYDSYINSGMGLVGITHPYRSPPVKKHA